MEKKALEELVKTVHQKLRPSTDEEQKKPFLYLNQKLEEMGKFGEVVSILVYDGHGKINCYGQRISEDQIFSGLNLTLATQGSRVTGSISYPEIHRLSSYETGVFVEGVRFDLDDFQYVALVNIAVNPDEPCFSYHNR